MSAGDQLRQTTNNVTSEKINSKSTLIDSISIELKDIKFSMRRVLSHLNCDYAVEIKPFI